MCRFVFLYDFLEKSAVSKGVKSIHLLYHHYRTEMKKSILSV